MSERLLIIGLPATHLWCNILEICAILISNFQLPMEFLIRLCIVVVSDTLGLNIIKHMSEIMQFYEIPIFVSKEWVLVLLGHCDILLSE